MKLEQFLDTHDLNHSLLIGYYGGGNYGDELLLEVLTNLLSARDMQDIIIGYQQPAKYKVYHHEFGYARIDMTDKRLLFNTILRQKQIIIGGGGLWGLDMNLNVFMLSLLLFMSRWFLGKEVYLLGVGYYSSTSLLGRMSAWLAGKAATEIIARDNESLKNFKRVNRRHTSLDGDIGWRMEDIEPQTYTSELAELERHLPKVSQKTLFISLRRFKSPTNGYVENIAKCLEANQDKPIIVAIMEPESVDPVGYAQLKRWQKKYKNIAITDFTFNPFVLFLFFRKHHQRLALIGPQFHLIMTAYISKTPFLPVSYDNKVSELLKKIYDGTFLPINGLTPNRLQYFVDEFSASGE